MATRSGAILIRMRRRVEAGSALLEFLDGRGLSLPPVAQLALVSADRARMQACAAEVRGLPLVPERLDEFGKTCK